MNSTEGQKTSKLALRFFSNATFYGLGAVLVRFGSFLILPLYWQILKPADFGRIAIAQMTTSLLASIYDLGLSGSVQRHFFEWKVADRPKHLAAVWSFSLLFSTILSVFLTYLAPVLLTVFNQDVTVEIILIGIWTAFFQNFGIIPFSLCRIREQLPLFSALSLGQFLSQSLGALYALFVLHKGYMGFLYGVLGGSFVYALACLVFTAREIRFPWKWADLKGTLHYALPTVPAAILEGMGTVVDRFFLQNYISLGELGLYSLARQFGQAYNFFQGTLKNSWVPLVYRIVVERKDAPKILGRMSSYYFLMLTIPGLAISVLAKDLVHLINRPDYFGITDYIPAIVVAFMTTGMGNIYGRGLDLAKKTQYYWIIYAGNFLTNLLLLIYLAPKFGAWGAIIALILSGVVREVLQIGLAFYFYPRILELKPIITAVPIQLVCYFLSKFILIENIWLSIGVKTILIVISSAISIYFVVGPQGFLKVFKFIERKIKLRLAS